MAGIFVAVWFTAKCWILCCLSVWPAVTMVWRCPHVNEGTPGGVCLHVMVHYFSFKQYIHQDNQCRKSTEITLWMNDLIWPYMSHGMTQSSCVQHAGFPYLHDKLHMANPRDRAESLLVKRVKTHWRLSSWRSSVRTQQFRVHSHTLSPFINQ